MDLNLRKLARAGQRRKARPRGGPVRPVQTGESVDPLSGVAFGSKQAREDAQAAGLSWRDFADSDVVPSGEKGYLVEDVKEIAEQAGRV